MKCLNCGKVCTDLLCNNCKTNTIIDKIYNEILGFKAEQCANKFLIDYSKKLNDIKEIKKIIPDLIKFIDSQEYDYYYCHYLKISRNEDFEKNAIEYLNKNTKMDLHKQQILYDLINFYLRNDYIKPEKWCNMILNEKELAVELYHISTEFYSMIGEYEIATKVLKYGRIKLKNNPKFLFSNKDNMNTAFEKLECLIERYKKGNPYWPNTEERRKMLAPIYDKKGITYPRIEKLAKKIKESEFKPIKELYDSLPSEYMIFWCSSVSVTRGISAIYEIAVLHIKNG